MTTPDTPGSPEASSSDEVPEEVDADDFLVAGHFTGTESFFPAAYGKQLRDRIEALETRLASGALSIAITHLDGRVTEFSDVLAYQVHRILEWEVSDGGPI